VLLPRRFRKAAALYRYAVRDTFMMPLTPRQVAELDWYFRGRRGDLVRPSERHGVVLLQDGAPITYVSKQLGHKDASITLGVYAHWLPDASSAKLVDSLDDAAPHVTQASPRAFDAGDQKVLSALDGVVSQTFASWNQIAVWLRQLDGFRSAA